MDSTPLPIKYPRRRVIRTALRTTIRGILSLITQQEVEGIENFPKNGPLLIVGNHFSFLDPVATIGITPYPLEFISGTRSPNAPGWTETFREAWGVLHIRRGASSRDGLLAGQSVLHQSGVLAIFPEGGNWASVLRPPRPGAALLALRANAPILPIGLDGLVDVFPNLRKGRKTRVHVRIGKLFGPFDPKGSGISTRQYMDEMGHEMMKKIAELLPPERRGFYSNDPAVREAARGTEIYPWDENPEN